MKVFLLLIMIHLLIFVYSIPVYADDESSKTMHEKAQKLKKRLRDLEQNEIILTHDEEASTQVIENLTPPNIIPITTINTTLMPSDEIITPPLPDNTKQTQSILILTYGNFQTQKTSPRSIVSTYDIEYTLLVYYHTLVRARVITITIRVYMRVPIGRNGRGLQEEEYELVPEDVETECILNGDSTSQGTRVYDCSGTTKTEAEEMTNAKVNTNEDIILDGEHAKPEEVGLTAQAITVGQDLISNSEMIDTSSKYFTLIDGILTNKSENTFSILGTIEDFNHKSGDIFDLNLVHLNDGTNKRVECKIADPIEKVDDTKSKVTINCGPYSEFLNSTLDYVTGNFRENPFDTITLQISEKSERIILMNIPNTPPLPSIIPMTTANTTLMPSDEIITPPLPVNTKQTQSIQILTYGNFQTQKTSPRSIVSSYDIEYTLLVYYHNRPPARVITITIRVYVRVPIERNGRSLQEEEYDLVPEDVETTCTLNGDSTSQGTRVYDCSGTTKTEAEEIINAKVNTNEDVILDGENANPEELALTGQAITVGEDLFNNSEEIDTSSKFLTLTDGILTNKSGNTFSIVGTIDDFNHKSGDIFDLNLIHLDDGTNKKIECKIADPIEKVDDTKSKVTINCGPYSEYLNSNLDFATGTFRGITADIITINLEEDSDRTIVSNNPNTKNQLTNSVIAGFVIIASLLSFLAFIIFSFFK